MKAAILMKTKIQKEFVPLIKLNFKEEKVIEAHFMDAQNISAQKNVDTLKMHRSDGLKKYR